MWTEKYGRTGEAADAAHPQRVGAALTAEKNRRCLSRADKVPVDLWYSPTHYGDTEASVAEVIKRSLEATGRFQVKVSQRRVGRVRPEAPQR